MTESTSAPRLSAAPPPAIGLSGAARDLYRALWLHAKGVRPQMLGAAGLPDIGHFFPNTDPQADTPHPVVRLTPDPLPPEAPFDRISLTIPSLLASDEIVFVIRGADKRAVFDAAVRGENDLPVARLLRASTQPVTCFA